MKLELEQEEPGGPLVGRAGHGLAILMPEIVEVLTDHLMYFEGFKGKGITDSQTGENFYHGDRVARIKRLLEGIEQKMSEKV